MIPRIGLAVASITLLFFLGIVAVAALQPSTLHLERSVTVSATPADAFTFANDLRAFVAWSPWSERDPDAKVTFSETSGGVDAWYGWDGNDEVGAGRMTVLVSEPHQRVVHELAFIRPFEDQATATFTFEAVAEGTTRITWAFDQTDLPLMSKLAGLMFDMEEMIGADYEAGLARLGPMVEAAAAARHEAERRASVKAASKATQPVE